MWVTCVTRYLDICMLSYISYLLLAIDIICRVKLKRDDVVNMGTMGVKLKMDSIIFGGWRLIFIFRFKKTILNYKLYKRLSGTFVICLPSAAGSRRKLYFESYDSCHMYVWRRETSCFVANGKEIPFLQILTCRYCTRHRTAWEYRNLSGHITSINYMFGGAFRGRGDVFKMIARVLQTPWHVFRDELDKNEAWRSRVSRVFLSLWWALSQSTDSIGQGPVNDWLNWSRPSERLSQYHVHANGLLVVTHRMYHSTVL